MDESRVRDLARCYGDAIHVLGCLVEPPAGSGLLALYEVRHVAPIKVRARCRLCENFSEVGLGDLIDLAVVYKRGV